MFVTHYPLGMRSRIISIALIAIVFSVKAQTWSPVSTGINGVAANTTWSLYAYDSVLYAGGWFTSAGGVNVNDIAQWNGVNWGTMGTGSSGYVSALAYYNGNLYAGGKFDSIGGVVAHDIAMWNGVNWVPVGKGMKSPEYGVYCMTVYNGDLYVGGNFDSVDGKAIFALAKYNGTAWSAVGLGLFTTAADEDDGVFAMAVYKGALYVGGGIDNAGGIQVSEVAEWDGKNWYPVGDSTIGPMYAMAVYNNYLYVGGWADTIGGIATNSIAKWNGKAWSAVNPGGITGEPGGSQVSALTVYNGELYAGGYFDSINGLFINGIAKWNDTNWSRVGGSVGINIGGAIDAMTVFNNSLYVGGGFDSAGGVYAHNIAMWTSPNSIDEVIVNNTISVFPSPTNDMISIKVTHYADDMSFIIYNELGQQIKNGKLSENESNTIDVSNYSSGIYLVSVVSGTQKYNAKFIKN
jgi:hypothetical protein